MNKQAIYVFEISKFQATVKINDWKYTSYNTLIKLERIPPTCGNVNQTLILKEEIFLVGLCPCTLFVGGVIGIHLILDPDVSRDSEDSDDSYIDDKDNPDYYTFCYKSIKIFENIDISKALSGRYLSKGIVNYRTFICDCCSVSRLEIEEPCYKFSANTIFLDEKYNFNNYLCYGCYADLCIFKRKLFKKYLLADIFLKQLPTEIFTKIFSLFFDNNFYEIKFF